MNQINSYQFSQQPQNLLQNQNNYLLIPTPSEFQPNLQTIQENGLNQNNQIVNNQLMDSSKFLI